jgi:hypothetical protein
MALAGFQTKRNERPYQGKEKTPIARSNKQKSKKRKKTRTRTRKTMRAIMAAVCLSH